MLARYDPFQDFFRTPFANLQTPFGALVTSNGDAKTARADFIPNVDVRETDDALILSAELPGIAEEDIDVEVEKNVLTLKGERSHEETQQEDNWMRTERSYGSFERRFVLPDTVSTDDVVADLQNGVLTLTFAKTADVKPKKIAIGG